MPTEADADQRPGDPVRRGIDLDRRPRERDGDRRQRRVLRLLVILLALGPLFAMVVGLRPRQPAHRDLLRDDPVGQRRRLSSRDRRRPPDPWCRARATSRARLPSTHTSNASFAASVCGSISQVVLPSSSSTCAASSSPFATSASSNCASIDDRVIRVATTPTASERRRDRDDRPDQQACPQRWPHGSPPST